MNILTYALVLLTLGGCNLSDSKSPLLFKEIFSGIQPLPTNGISNFEQINSLILTPKCLSCHSSAGGDAGGLNLETYENVLANLSFIKSEVQADTMPKNKTKLNANEKALLFKWIDAGGPKEETTTPPSEIITYDTVKEKVLAPRCIGCHSDEGGNRGDVNLETYENVLSFASLIESEIISGSMPRPRNKPLSSEQKTLILKWIKDGALKE